jgi:hypothetical protein
MKSCKFLSQKDTTDVWVLHLDRQCGFRCVEKILYLSTATSAHLESVGAGGPSKIKTWSLKPPFPTCKAWVLVGQVKKKLLATSAYTDSAGVEEKKFHHSSHFCAGAGGSKNTLSFYCSPQPTWTARVSMGRVNKLHNSSHLCPHGQRGCQWAE